jgi:hypothetical protein
VSDYGSGPGGTAFLIGSGASRDAGIPGVEEISEAVRFGEGVFFGTDGIFHLDPFNPNLATLRSGPESVVERVLECLGVLDEVVGRYYGLWSMNHVPDYEELANLAAQLDGALTTSRENAALVPLVTELADILTGGDVWQLRRLVSRLQEYVVDVAWAMLDRIPSRTDHLKVIIDGCRDLGQTDLFTLNHDLMLETALGASSLSFSDGFERRNGDLRIWSDTYEHPIRLFKLHGSISWWGYQLPDEPWRGYITATVTNRDAYHALDANGEMLVPHDLRPVFLAGTFEKLFGYESWILPDQHFRFQESLRRVSRLIIIGYGFRDQAINSRLIGWLSRARENRIVIVHGHPLDIQKDARLAIRNGWERWIQEGRIRIVPAWVADATWADVVELL